MGKLNDLAVVGRSTYTDKNGKKGGEWVKTARKPLTYADLLDVVRESFKRVPVIPAKRGKEKKASNTDFAYVYAVGDHHIGMYSWARETGANYDVDIAVKLLRGAIENLTQRAKAKTQAMVVFLGDFLHYDSLEAVTPAHKNQLDSDTRFPRMVNAGIGLVCDCIEALRRVHHSVHVIVEQGNHDPSSAIILREAVAMHYSAARDVSVDDAPGVYHYWQFGSNLIGTHHGDKVKNLQLLPSIMATDRPKAWGQTKYRLYLTGHYHRDMELDMPGCTVRSVRILPPTDAWGHESGFRSRRSMTMLELHREFGEVGRYYVTPEMLEEGTC